jgi:hypothetical protein
MLTKNRSKAGTGFAASGLIIASACKFSRQMNRCVSISLQRQQTGAPSESSLKAF